VAEIWRTRDWLGREIVLTDSGWTHILERRPGMAGSEAAVRTAVEAPDRVARDAQYADRESYYRRLGPRRYLKVVVAYAATGHGVVITAYPIPRPKRGEQPRWP
jgi:hypothetical protein